MIGALIHTYLLALLLAMGGTILECWRAERRTGARPRPFTTVCGRFLLLPIVALGVAVAVLWYAAVFVLMWAEALS